jgi:hypothetical protein
MRRNFSMKAITSRPVGRWSDLIAEGRRPEARLGIERLQAEENLLTRRRHWIVDEAIADQSLAFGHRLGMPDIVTGDCAAECRNRALQAG